MGFVGGLLGIGNKGMNFNAQGIPIEQGVTTGQTGQAYNQAQSGMAQQLAFLNALQGQNGIGNQSNVFSQQQGLADQLQGMVNGTGPNPALQQLQNTTGQNVANQAALMAGQRGAGSNAGLLARQAAQQGGSIQQQSVGQGALMQAQQQMAAMSALQQQQGMMGNLATQQVGQQAGALTGYNQMAQSEQQSLLNALGQYNNARVGMQSNINSSNAGIAGITAKGQQDLFGGALKGAAMAGGAYGGEVPAYADGGEVQNGPTSFAGKFLNGWMNELKPLDNSPIQPASPSPTLEKGSNAMGALIGKGIKAFASSGAPAAMAEGGEIPQNFTEKLRNALQNPMGAGMDSPYNPDAIFMPEGEKAGKEFIKKEDKPKENKFSKGAVVPGSAAFGGDNVKNDKVPAMLSPKEIVLPRSVTLGANAPEKAKQFVAAVLAKNGMRK